MGNVCTAPPPERPPPGRLYDDVPMQQELNHDVGLVKVDVRLEDPKVRVTLFALSSDGSYIDGAEDSFDVQLSHRAPIAVVKQQLARFHKLPQLMAAGETPHRLLQCVAPHEITCLRMGGVDIVSSLYDAGVEDGARLTLAIDAAALPRIQEKVRAAAREDARNQYEKEAERRAAERERRYRERRITGGGRVGTPHRSPLPDNI